MAKPKIQLDAYSGRDLCIYLNERVEKDDFDKNFVGFSLWGNRQLSKEVSDAGWDQFNSAKETFKEIHRKIRTLVPRHHEKDAEKQLQNGWEDAVHELREWILKEITPEGWTRIQAARRKATQSGKSRWQDGSTIQILTTRRAALTLGNLAKRHSVDRSELISKLALWLENDPVGEAAFSKFAAANGLLHEGQAVSNSLL